jgi:hypothetical protein
MLAPDFTFFLVYPSLLKLAKDLIGLIIVWIIVSIPVYLAAKVFTGGRAHFTQALLATLVGPIIFALVLALGYAITSRVATGLGIVALFFAFLAWLWVFKATFRTGWIRALGIAILSVIVGVILIAILEFLGLMFRNVLVPNLAILFSLLH